MRKFYKKISWLLNGVIIGLIIAGLIDHSFTTLIAGAVIGLITALIFKVMQWRRQSRW